MTPEYRTDAALSTENLKEYFSIDLLTGPQRYGSFIAMTTRNYPAAATVTKALRRDAGIITVQTYDRRGYRVRGADPYPTSIFADMSDLMDSAEDCRAAAGLAEKLEECGWEIKLDEARIVVFKVPTIAEIRKANQKEESK
jgi:hypothetical protein